MDKQKVELGCEVLDVVTGFKGIVTGVSTFLYGCSRIGVQAKADKAGNISDARWFDEPQLKVIKTAKQTKVKQGNRDTGGPMPSTPTRNTCK